MTVLFWFFVAVGITGAAVIIACLAGFVLALRRRDPCYAPDSDVYDGGPGDPVECAEDARGARWSPATLARMKRANVAPLKLNRIPKAAA